MADRAENKSRAPVSVIIPCYCCCDTIQGVVKSVISQSSIPRELILVDDASPDQGATLQLLYWLQNKYADCLHIRVIALESNGGPSSARNVGWDAATQPYIAFLDADDGWCPDKIEVQYHWMLSRPEVDICGHVNARSSLYQRSEYCDADHVSRTMISKRKLLLRNYLITSSVMMKRDIPLRFEVGMYYCEDYALWLLAVHRGYCLARLNIPLGLMCKEPFGESGLSGKLWKMEIGELHCFLTLYKKRLLGFASLLCVSLFSVMKFIRRVVVVAVRDSSGRRKQC